jgi:hypothetical protein
MRRAEYNDLALKKLPTRKLVHVLGIAAAAAVLAVAGLSIPWHGDRPAAPPRLLSSARGAGPLTAGAASVNIDLPKGTPIGGFARRSYAAEGVREPVTARALFLEVPGARVAVVSAELLFVSDPLRDRVSALVADLKLDALLVGATHTHAGPGGYFDDVAFELGALGPFDASVEARLAAAIAESVREAVTAAVPARLAVARGSAPPLVRSRSGGQPDGRLLSLRLSAQSGEPLAELLVFAAHATTLGKANRRLSGDWPGRFLAAPGRGVRLFLQGPVGDQSARVPPGDPANAPDRFAAAVGAEDEALVESKPIAAPVVSAASVAVTLPPPSPGAVPRLLRPAATTLAWGHLPASARVTALRLGPVLLVAVPAEPTAALAERWRTQAGSRASDVASLVDGYIGYVEDAERTRRGEGEAGRTYYGPELAQRLEAGVAAAVAAVGE